MHRSSCFRNRSKIRQDFLGVLGWIDLGISLHDFLIRSDEIADAICILSFGAFTRSVRHSHGPTRVAKEGKGEIELLGERPVLFDGVEADAQNLNVSFFERCNVIAEPATLGGSPRGVGFGIKPKENVSPGEIGELDRAARVIRQLEGRSLLTRIQHECLQEGLVCI